MTGTWLSTCSNGYRLAVQVATNARKTEVAGSDGDVIRIKLQAQPIDGKANEVLIQFLSKKLRVPKRQITITHGLSSRRKLLEIATDALSEDEIRQQLSLSA